MKLNIRHSTNLLVGASLIALAAPAIAQAQTAGSQAISGTVSEVVVTAQRRSERLVQVPISITALNASNLAKAGVVNMIDLAKLVPGLTMPMSGGLMQPSIRGVSNDVSPLGASVNTAIYVDGVYQAINYALSGNDLPDTVSVQVLKGPQGSLYGQNAEGGAIIIDTIAPSFTWKGKALINYGTFNNFTAQGYVAGPITNTLAFSATASYNRRDGYNKNLLTGGHDKGLLSNVYRAKLLWQPTNDLSFTLQAFYSRNFNSAPFTGPALNGNTDTAAWQRQYFPNLPLATHGNTFTENVPGVAIIRTWGVSLLGKYRAGDIGTFNTVTAYQNDAFTTGSDIDRSPVNFLTYYGIFSGKFFSQEANFVSNKFADRIQVTAGMFFMTQVANYEPNLARIYSFGPPAITAFPTVATPLGAVGATVSEAHRDSYAAYLEANVDITSKLILTLAGRYAYETSHVLNTPLPFSYQKGQPFPALLADPRGSFNWSKFTPKAVLRYKIDPNNSVYFSYSQGFKSGIINTNNVNNCTPQPTCIDAPVAPESVSAFEIGYKGDITRQLSVTAAVYHYDYNQIQVFVYNPLGVSFYQNAATGKIDGGELGVTYVPMRGLTLNTGVNYEKARYGKFPGANVFKPVPGFGNVLTKVDASGNPIIRSPDLTVNASMDYVHDFASVGQGGLYIAGRYTSEITFDANNRVRQPGYFLLDAELSFSPVQMPQLRFVLWGKNLSNTIYFNNVLEGGPGDNSTWAEPRTFGLRAEYKF